METSTVSPRSTRSWATTPAAGPGASSGGQLAPRVLLGDHLGEWPDREQPGVVGDHRRRPLGRRPQRQAVLGERRDRPQLTPGRHRVAGAVAQRAAAPPSRRRRARRSTRRTRASRSARWTSSSSVVVRAGRLIAQAVSRTSHERPRVAAAAAVDREGAEVRQQGCPCGDRRHLVVARAARRRRRPRRARPRRRTASINRRGSGSPANSQITVRSLNWAAKHSPLSIAHTRSVAASSRQCPLLRSVLLASTSNTAMSMNCSTRSARASTSEK